MLLSALNRHTEVLCYSEVFNPKGPLFGVRGMPSKPSSTLKHYRNLFPIAFLNTQVYRGLEDHLQAVGFKILSSQLHWCRNHVLMERLASDEQTRIIRLYRENKLKMLFSLTLAKQSGVWSSSGTPSKPTAIRLDAKQCEQAFSRFEEDEVFLRSTFEGDRLFSVSYEQLVNDPASHLSRIQAHLGLDIERLGTTKKKQRRWPLCELISNYEELRQYFEGTEWGHFFERDE
jgi:hypothetical protein